MTSNIEPLAREMAMRICRRSGMPEGEIPRWVELHWPCAAAMLEAGVMDEGGDGSNTGMSAWGWRPTGNGSAARNEASSQLFEADLRQNAPAEPSRAAAAIVPPGSACKLAP